MSHQNQVIEIPNKIFVKGVPKDTVEEDLIFRFEEFGKVVDCRIVRDLSTGNSRGYGFITFDSQNIAEKVREMGRVKFNDDIELVIGRARIKKLLLPVIYSVFNEQSLPISVQQASPTPVPNFSSQHLLNQLRSTGPPPAKKTKIDSIPVVITTQKDVDEKSCAVCRSEYSIGEEGKRLPCDHIFHPACIDPWLQLHDSCPICRCNFNGERPNMES